MSNRVLLVIDDPFELSSVAAGLKLHGVNIVGEAQKMSAAIILFRSMQPNVIVLDMHRSHESSIDIAATVRKESASIGVVLLSSCADLRLVGKNAGELPKGVKIVLKNSPHNLSSLCDVISDARRFEDQTPICWISGGVTIEQRAAQNLMSQLSNIQIETLRYIADGLTNAEIGRIRFVSEKAIEQIVSRIAMSINIQPDPRKNMRVQLVQEYMKWIGAPSH